jgi:hypothetical protein
MKTLLLIFILTAAAYAGNIDQYNIVWDSQSKSSADSMPLAGGNLGLNVWVENNDLLLLIGCPNCLDENGMQNKLGLVRLCLDPVAFAENFRQELNLERSEIVVSGKSATVRLWCDVFQPVIHAEITSETPVTVSASYETWSNYEARFVDGGLQWVRRLAPVNQRRMANMKAQGVAEFAQAVPDPLSNLTMGGRLIAPGLKSTGTGIGKFNGMNTKTWTLQTEKPVRQLDLRFALRMEQDASPADWERKLAATPAGNRDASLKWWREFWNRSYIVINSGAKPDDKNWQAGRNYQLFRYMLAANRAGRAMTLFNGGNFTCTGNPDSRNWDGCQFMAQNQMLVYWPMQRSGDFDLLKVGCDFYRDCTPLRRLHAKKFWGIDGVTYPEPLSIFGLDAIGTTADGRSSPRHLNYHYTSGMVFALMMLGHDSYAGTMTPNYADAAFGIISYYDQYYQKKLQKETGKPLDANGKLVIYPSDACEPYHGCVNNLDVLAGLQALVRDLLATPPATLGSQKRTYLESFRKRIPELKTEEKNGRKLYAAADKPPEWIFHNTNMDFPQMYICFPFSAVSLGRSDMTLVKNTWELGPVNATVQHQNQCWYQNSINFARMGETAKAADFTLKKLLHPGLRFPAFYYTTYIGGGSFCHPPDHDHGGVAMTALQEMLMQTDGKRILLGPAWPAEWDCDFKLHAPYQTIVEGKVTGGKVIVTKVTPASRQADIEIFPLKNLPPTPLSQGKSARASTNWHGTGYDAGKAVDGNDATRWGSAEGARTGWLEVDLGKPAAISRVVLMERAYPSVTEFTIEAQQPDDSWKTVVTGTTIGHEKELTFPAVTAQKFRANVKQATGNLNIEEFQLYAK